jgi:CheY-like chemotaxis protein
MTSALLLLLVEDEALLRDMLEAGLSDGGFEIALAINGKQGLARLEANAAQFKAVITDIKMGDGPDGWEIGRRARELVSDMPVIYMSGDSGHDWSSKGVPNSVMLPKLGFAGAVTRAQHLCGSWWPAYHEQQTADESRRSIE